MTDMGFITRFPCCKCGALRKVALSTESRDACCNAQPLSVHSGLKMLVMPGSWTCRRRSDFSSPNKSSNSEEKTVSTPHYISRDSYSQPLIYNQNIQARPEKLRKEPS
ncbi:hypothetical protein TWF694_007264 [Orbilia ellipsospora]|uniref:Uncharacterized protein n=1 Tax=Orbilia ellipsospora TaxID=2528407 RepID=A0AAV9XJW3_9PEZI